MARCPRGPGAPVEVPSRRVEPRTWWRAGGEKWRGGGPGGRRTAGVWRGLCYAPDVAWSAGAMRAAGPGPLVGELRVLVHS
ncbi:hypothetical protein NDU88_006768 [Pleurodeles waltl]|uniref:Uncharacterized protein n=1 Tax=Pleurodeles waltl TaxID=8319 RepID=A0AAV7VRM2_PLEWA|nr:hypothetical protein NDU88_006768 [Pleurodeles waltl]